uniref:Glucosylceramidase n=1 Tax=Naja naja TaxID=35670 RepID=A0A8C6X581_NAJNA
MVKSVLTGLYSPISPPVSIFGRFLASQPCSPKFIGANAMVCVCNATYCDTVDPVSLPDVGYYVKYTTSRDGQRLERSEGQTDTSIGIEYNLLRWPIGCSDFSTRPYSYNDHCVDDFELKCFQLAPEDTQVRIPLLHRIMAHAKRPLSLVGSPWTSPAWLRVNNRVHGKSTLKGRPGDRYYKAWARYFIRFLDDSQNEPITALFVSREDFPCNYFSPQLQRDFIIQDLGPALVDGGYADIRLMILDDGRCHLPNWADQVGFQLTAAAYVSGIGIHWYFDLVTPAGLTLDVTHHLYPDFFLLYTEACNGFLDWDVKVALGSWERGSYYSRNILMNLNHFVTGWIDWNLALDMKGGPNWVDNNVDSPIIVNPLKDEFYKQPMFYHLAHFSKFIPEGSVRVALTSKCLFGICQLKTSAFLRPDGTAVVVVLNE